MVTNAVPMVELDMLEAILMISIDALTELGGEN